MLKNTHDFPAINGKFVNLREVEIADAEFILSLRTSEKGLKFLHKTDYDINKQVNYIKNYKNLDNEWYFIVEDKKLNPIGCLSVYDIKESSACTGRWIMKKSSNIQSGIEGDLLLKNFAFNILNVESIRMDTKHSNKNMINYFNQWGCKVISTTDELIYVVLTRDAYEKHKYKIERFCK